MIWCRTICATTCALGLLWMSMAQAAPPKYSVPKALTERYQMQRLKHQKPRFSTPDMELSNAKSLQVDGVLHRLDDGAVLLRREVEKAQISVLKRTGARIVERAQDVTDHTIFEGHYFRRYQLIPVKGPHRLMAQLELWKSKRVRLTLRRLKTGKFVVVDVRGVR